MIGKIADLIRVHITIGRTHATDARNTDRRLRRPPDNSGPAAWARCTAPAIRSSTADVALKVLPEAFTADPDRLARFEREARVPGLAEPPEHRPDPRLGGHRRHARAGPGAGRGADPGRPPRAGADSPRSGAVHRAADRPGPAGRARSGRDPSGSQAGQRQGAGGRDREGPGLRPRQGAGHGAGAVPRRGPAAVADPYRLGDPDGRRPDPGYAGLHVPGAGRGATDRHARGPLVVRRRALRDAGRRAALRRRDCRAGARQGDRPEISTCRLCRHRRRDPYGGCSAAASSATDGGGCGTRARRSATWRSRASPSDTLLDEAAGATASQSPLRGWRARTAWAVSGLVLGCLMAAATLWMLAPLARVARGPAPHPRPAVSDGARLRFRPLARRFDAGLRRSYCRRPGRDS